MSVSGKLMLAACTWMRTKLGLQEHSADCDRSNKRNLSKKLTRTGALARAVGDWSPGAALSCLWKSGCRAGDIGWPASCGLGKHYRVDKRLFCWIALL